MNRRNLLGIVSIGTAVAVVATGCSSTKSDSNTGGSPTVVLSQQPSASATATVPLPDKAKKNYKITFIQGVEGDPLLL